MVVDLTSEEIAALSYALGQYGTMGGRTKEIAHAIMAKFAKAYEDHTEAWKRQELLDKAKQMVDTGRFGVLTKENTMPPGVGGRGGNLSYIQTASAGADPCDHALQAGQKDDPTATCVKCGARISR